MDLIFPHCLQARSVSLSPTYALPPVSKRSQVRLKKHSCASSCVYVTELIFPKHLRNPPGGLLTFPRPAWPLPSYGRLWYSGSLASTCTGGEGILESENQRISNHVINSN